MYFNTIPLAHMIAVVEFYIFRYKGIRVKIKEPENDKQLQLLGIAYDFINENKINL
jgi:hypothetical protein